MKLKIEIEIAGAAFAEDSGAEVARILETLASAAKDKDFTITHDSFILFDINGNKVGKAIVW